ncbi:MAG: beta-propeller domain-containing protein [Verrucomicrobiota bacterium]
MKLPLRLTRGPLSRFVMLMLASTALASAAPQPASGRKSLEISIHAERGHAKVTVPEGIESVILQKFRRDGGWTRVAVRKAVPGVMRFKLPAGKADARWRAIGIASQTVVSHDKFPAKFYQGENRFEPTKSVKGGKRLARLEDAGLAAVDGPVEADIWKVDGNTVYFFNQSRGLQVLDLTNPADPRITASLRMPAVGQDLYLLPGSGPDRSLVLLTQGWSGDSGEWTEIKVIRVSGGEATVTSSQRVAGYLADSRMVGKRLILATTEWNAPADDSNDDWSATTRLTEWRVSEDSAPAAAGKTEIAGDSPVISAGTDWLAIAVHPTNQWDVSEVSVFALRPSGLVRMAAPIRTEGSVEDNFGMQWRGNVLTTVSEKNTDENGWSPVTVLENFRAWAPEVIHIQMIEERLGHLRLAKGESLFATRFAGDKAYIVTFLQTDPLFVVDLSDERNPEVAGHIEVPGWSTHLEPMGDLLFSIGWEANAPVASLFDVADPAKPALLRRIALGTQGTYSEALWDEQALKLLPAAGLAMVPLSTYDRKSGETSSVVRLLDVDTTARDLRLRGTIPHDFDARRADLLGNAVVSISQRVMVAADIADRNAPKLLSEVSLAWPVDRVLEVGKHLLQIEDGSSYGGGRATVRVSPAQATEQILAEIDLGKGTVKAAEIRDGKLAVLRETEAQPLYYYQKARVIGGGGGDDNRMVLDLYDTSALPTLTLIGRCGVKLPEGGHVSLEHLLWPQPNRPATVVDFGYSFIWGPIFRADVAASFADAAAPLRKKSILIEDVPPFGVSEKAPRVVIFDITDAVAPVVGESVVLGPDDADFSGLADAADGLVVVGSNVWKDQEKGRWFQSGKSQPKVRVLEVDAAGSPLVRPAIDLPGELFAVTDLDRDGFLAWTRSAGEGNNVSLQVSACDGYDAFAITGMDVPANAAVAAGGRRLFVATQDGVERSRLSTGGELLAESTLDTGWRADSLRWENGKLTGARWNAIFVADDKDGVVTRWKFPTWNPGVEHLVHTKGGDVLVPLGEYGVERLER